MTDRQTIYDRFNQRYQDDEVPWDDTVPPPEIIALAEKMPPGRALDLGCGYGRTAIYLAERGWEAVGVDFIVTAVEVATARAVAAGVAGQATFHQASADQLDFLEPAFDLAIDIGCMHSFTEEMAEGYRDELLRLLRPGATYMLFAHLQDEAFDAGVDSDERPRGIAEARIIELFDEGFQLDAAEYGVTQVDDKPPWRSAWYWFQRLP